MKAKLEKYNGIEHLIFTPKGMDSPTIIPVITKGTRAGISAWTWNGSLEKPTIKPSVRTQYVNNKGENQIIHYWLSDGVCECLNDCTDGNAGKFLQLEDLED